MNSPGCEMLSRRSGTSGSFENCAIFPSTGTSNLDASEGNMSFSIEQTVSDTANPAIRKIEVAVSDARDPTRVLSRLSAYVSP